MQRVKKRAIATFGRIAEPDGKIRPFGNKIASVRFQHRL